ncbi:hypothetical protein D3C87_1382780 [compost metagenome]
MKLHIAHGRLHRSAQGGLLAHHQGKHAQVGQVSAFRHQQAECFLAGKACRLFQQPADRITADQQIRIVKHTEWQFSLPQHPKRIQPDCSGDGLVAGQTGTANQVGHAVTLCPIWINWCPE